MKVCDRSFVLLSRPFRNTSALVDLFTLSHGRIRVIVKGLRGKKSTLRGVLQPFVPLQVSWMGRSDLKTLTQAEALAPQYALKGQVLYCGLYLNELLMKLMPSWDEHSHVFQIYVETLQHLQAGEAVDIALRRFESALLTDLGYGIPLLIDGLSQDDVVAEGIYSFDSRLGVTRRKVAGNDTYSGESLLAIADDDYSVLETRRDAKRLFRQALAILLDGKEIVSRRLF